MCADSELVTLGNHFGLLSAIYHEAGSGARCGGLK